MVLHCHLLYNPLIAAGLKYKSDQDHNLSSGALIVDNIGLSPLLLGAAGILHEARYARHAIRNHKVEWLVVLQYHMLVSAGLALIAVSISNLVKPDSSGSGLGLLKGGFAVLFISWVILFLATVFSMQRPASFNQLANDESFRNGALLLNAALLSLPMTLLRAVYGAINLFGSGKSVDTAAFSSNIPADVCMSLIPPMLATFAFVGVGLITPRS
ncbi:conserved hypothetical protein [Talaromyces stipitatus ATCC 10500]|uniref:DUF7702 domain-containing protein n=1 Tax=Talaromyces stipitatus (strain ATCC 10500 / CBS 375.48 / QM 6759 / NRRL 1006) TaxID=441959 RepID=B8MJ16_TALSN|nr:uncharacterized protein TSTA_051160 [Talaromyces stipitatus ATCC 10500]EED15678.1 conserved hypothetical protein [Talaromyces stipitatus ATCC 10500]